MKKTVGDKPVVNLMLPQKKKKEQGSPKNGGCIKLFPPSACAQCGNPPTGVQDTIAV